jgi:hypothetical protein
MCANEKTADDCPQKPENDECETAVSVSTFPFTVTGSTLLASPLNIGGYGVYNGYGGYNGNNSNSGGYGEDDDREGEDNNDDAYVGYGYNGTGYGGYGYNGTSIFLPPDIDSGCSYLDPSSKSVWYLVEGGEGSCMSASVTSRDFNPSVSVFRGNQCGELTCISRNEQYSSNGISWQSEVGETYYVVVGGIYGSAGDFSLNIEVSGGFGMATRVVVSLFVSNTYVCNFREVNALITTSVKLPR